ncbi:hypothetical protein FQN55_006477 [Onygenales sp. PD_40]|nr:hypothetical protein FQN55_006477 [Onygenales sp. PD_40]KAK2781664.1 hypothetical protein FQN53_000455 [Emmonsiellopsis sp. PD_33]
MQKSAQTSTPAPLACLACRRKHLKCDGIQPTCGRCHKAQIDCHYTPSRRGYRSTPRSKPVGASVGSPASSAVYSDQQSVPGMFDTMHHAMQPSEWPTQGPSLLQGGLEGLDASTMGGSNQGLLTQNNLLAIPIDPVPADNDFRLLDFYYAFFHDAHPILPPIQQLHALAPIPPSLNLVIKFIGAHFAFDVSADAYKAAAAEAIAQDLAPSFYKVQALLLFSTVLHARNDREEAYDSFCAAANLAIDLGMYQRSFMVRHGQNSFVREESLRRTWWELYICDAMFAAFDQCPCRISNLPGMDIPLPCDDASFATGFSLIDPPSLPQFYNRIFSAREHKYSSFCYAVEAAKLLSRALTLSNNIDNTGRDQVESLEANITSWFHHLPDDRPNALCADGNVDQMLFRAYMITHCASIYLHLPRSNLLATPTANASIACARKGPSLPPTSHTLTHAAKALEAANGIVALAALRKPLLKHTPFFICGLVLSAVVQLCAWSITATGAVEPRRDRLALIVGELKSLDRTWALAHQVMCHIKRLAREVLEIGVQSEPSRGLGDGEEGQGEGEIQGEGGAIDQGPDVSSLVSSEMWLGDIEFEQV